MKKIKLPYGIADYEALVENNCLYIDKTEYIEKIEDDAWYLVLLRPRRFGKSLFISTLANYYDINKVDKFDSLFGNTYIGKNPTSLKNSYSILEFDFSGLNTKNEETLYTSFVRNVYHSLYAFLEKYDLIQKIDFNYNIQEISNLISAADLLDEMLTKIINKIEKPIYVIIDEYDQFANELLGFHSDIFSKIVSEDGFIRTFYEVLKKHTKKSTISRIFITGVSPITLDSMTSGFNITLSLTCNPNFNNAMGFTRDEVKYLMQTVLDEDTYNEKSEAMLNEMQYNYDGYMFSKKAQNKIYNSDMCLYYLNNYLNFNEPPEELLDKNISSDYTKLTNLFALKTNEDRKRNYNTLEKILAGEEQKVKLTESFNFQKKFDEDDFISLLFYLGFLTFCKTKNSSSIMTVPNQTIKGLYFELFFETLKDQYQFNTSNKDIRNIFEVMSEQGKNQLLIENMEIILNAMSNRDFQGMNEQFVKSIAFTLSHFTDIYSVKSEYEVTNGYIDLAYLPKFGQVSELDYYGIIEFKYIKVADYEKDPAGQISEKKAAALEQLMRYVKDPELAALDKKSKLKKWIIIFCKDKCVLNEEI